MPMDVSDEGFRHVGQCKQLESLWCMYCRNAGDAATEQLGGLSMLKNYYAGFTQITDRSLQILGQIQSRPAPLFRSFPQHPALLRLWPIRQAEVFQGDVGNRLDCFFRGVGYQDAIDVDGIDRFFREQSFTHES